MTASDLAKLPDLEEDAFDARLAAALARARRDLFGTGAQDPEDPELSTEERDEILLSVGIDPHLAPDQVFEYEEEDFASARVWSCARCATTGGLAEVKYVKGELLCKPCSEAAQVEDRRAAEKAEAAEEKARVAVEVTRPPSPRAAAVEATLYGLLFFVGIAGPLWLLADMVILSILLGGGVAALGGSQVYKLTMDRAV